MTGTNQTVNPDNYCAVKRLADGDKMNHHSETITLLGFRTRKAAQIAAYFLTKNNAALDVFKLVKMLYLVERHSIATRSRPMIYDEHYSLNDGPTSLNVMNGINGHLDSQIWSEYLLPVVNGSVSPVAYVHAEDLDELSKSDMTSVNLIWDSFGGMSAAAILDYTNEECSEHKQVTVDRYPISYGEIATAVGIDNPLGMERIVDEYRYFQAKIGK